MDKEKVMKVTQNEFKIEELLILIWIPRAKEFVRQKQLGGFKNRVRSRFGLHRYFDIGLGLWGGMKGLNRSAGYA